MGVEGLEATRRSKDKKIKKRKNERRRRKKKKTPSSCTDGKRIPHQTSADVSGGVDCANGYGAQGPSDGAQRGATSFDMIDATVPVVGLTTDAHSGEDRRKHGNEGDCGGTAQNPTDERGGAASGDAAAAERRRLIKKKRRRERKNKKRRLREKLQESEKESHKVSVVTKTVSGEPEGDRQARCVGDGPPTKKWKGPTPTVAKHPSSTGASAAANIKPYAGGENGCDHAATARPAHPFAADESDHCETPVAAYRDVAPLLDKIASSLGKTRSTLVIYDPYYCAGGVKTKLSSLGFRSVINECRDFYADARDGTVPEHDVLLTNPPYSANHMEKLMRFAATGSCEKNSSAGRRSGGRRKPFLLLLPHFVYTKQYYRDIFPPSSEGRSCNPFYLVPRSRYAYVPPEWVSSENGGSTAVGRGKVDTAPFPSFWYCSVDSGHRGRDTGKVRGGGEEGVDADVRTWMAQTFGPSGVYKPGGGRKGGMSYADRSAHIPREFKGEFDSTKKRPNPRARKRMLAKKRKGAA